MTNKKFKQIVHEIQGKYFERQYCFNQIFLRNVKKVINLSNAFAVIYDCIIINDHDVIGHKCYTWDFSRIEDFYFAFGTRVKPFEYKSKLKILSNREDYEKEKEFKFKVVRNRLCYEY